MDVLTISDFDKLCRCCLYTPVAKPLRQMVPLNDWHLGVYCAITSLKFNAADALPKLICHQCNIKIRTIQNFADVCKKSNDWLNSRLNTIKNKTVSLKVENKEQLVENIIQITSEDTNDTLKVVQVNKSNKRFINTKKDHMTIINHNKNDTVRQKSLNKIKDKTVLPPKEENVEQLVNSLIEIVTVSESESEDDTKNIANEIQVNSEEVIGTINDSMTIKSDEDDANLNKIQTNSEQVINLENDLTKKTNEETVYRWQIPLNSCFTCKMKFATASLRDKHYKESDKCKPRQYPCRKCGKSFGRGSSLIAHQAVHSEERNYSCSKCGRTFKQRCAMTWHEKLVHNKDKALKFNCQFCARRFPQPGLLKEHELIHTDPSARKLKRKYKYQNNKQYFQKCICPICGKVLCSKYILPEHMRTHTGERPLKCTHCPKTFRTHQSLKIHTNIHLGIRPFSCDLCDKSFSQQQSLKAHMLVHTGEKPYQCDICAKKFRSRVNLRLHMTIHTGDKPIKCPHCDERFADYKIRRTHIHKVHEVSTSKKASNEQE